VDFFWINRDQRSFEWFVNLLSQLEVQQAEIDGSLEHFLDLHMYITSALNKTDMKAVGLQMAMDLLYAKVLLIFVYVTNWFLNNCFVGKTRLYYRTQNANQCGAAELVQNVPENSR